MGSREIQRKKTPRRELLREWHRYTTDRPRQDIQVVSEHCLLPTHSRLEDNEEMNRYLYQRSASNPVTRRQTNSASHSVEENEANWHIITSLYSSQSAESQLTGRETLQSSPYSTLKASSEESDLLLDPYMLAMATCGHWCPPAFLQTWSRQNPQTKSAVPHAELSSRYPKKPQKLMKKIARRYSEPSLNYWISFRFARPFSWVKRERNEKAGGNANLITPQQQQTEGSGDAKKPSGTISLHSTLQSFRLSRSTASSDSSPSTLQPTTSTGSSPSPDSQPNAVTLYQPEPRSASPVPSTASSLIFPGREITQEEYFRRTNRPQDNLQPRQLTPPPGLEEENDPYEWQAWNLGRVCQESKTDRMLGRRNLRRSSAGDASKGRTKNNWYDEFWKKMKEEQVQTQKERKEANKKKKKELEKLEKQERINREAEAREMLKKQGMFSVGYLPRYT